MLHAWEKFGLQAAEDEHLIKYDTKCRNTAKGKPSFAQIVKGKIEYLGMVRGKNDITYLKFKNQFSRLYQRDMENDSQA